MPSSQHWKTAYCSFIRYIFIKLCLYKKRLVILHLKTQHFKLIKTADGGTPFKRE